MQAAVVDDAHGIVQPEPVNFRLPIFLQRGRRDDQNMGTVIGKTVVVIKFLGDARGDDGFAEANHVRQKKTTVLLQFQPAVVHRVTLVAQ
jgi:hypothetical protein